MRKIFTFLFAALMSVSMFGKTVTEDISMDPANWTWGKNCNVTAVGNLLQGYITSEYGYMAIGWNPTIDLSSWDKLVVEVANTNGCGGEHYLIKAFLRDLVNKDVENGQMEAAIGPFEPEGRPYTLEINLKEEGKNVNLTACGVIGIQVQPNGAEFKISRVYLQKEVEDVTTYTLQLVADPEKGSVAVTNLLGSDIIDNGNGNYTVPENAEVTILATPLEGYEFSGWKEGNIEEMVGCYYCGTALNTEDNPYTFTMTADVAYLAEFAAKGEGIENIVLTEKAKKVVVDGMIYIVRDGKLFNLTGAQVK